MDSKKFPEIYAGHIMKLFIAFSLFILLLSPSNYPQWVPQSTGLSINIQKITFIDSLTGYLIDDTGHWAKTTDGGDSWVFSYTGFNTGLRGIHFTSESTGYISGFNGLIIKTTDGGSTWFQQQSHVSNILDNITFTSTNTGYIVGHSGTIIKTTDAGLNWTVMTYFTQEDLETICFTDSLNGYVAGTNSYRTTDGGVTWLQIINGSHIGRCVNFPDLITGYVGGNFGTIYKTTDKGVTWTQQNSSTSNDLYGIYFLNNQRGYAVGLNGTIICTTNGGTNWIKLESGTSLNLVSVYFLNNNKGFCVGGYPIQSVLLKTTNGGFPLKAVVSADTIYYDSGFQGNISQQISGSNSTGDNLEYSWLINDTTTYTGISPIILLHTGINKILLKVTEQSGGFNIDSVFSNVIASRNIIGGSIYSGVSQYNNHFYTTSMDKGVYEIDSAGNRLKSFLTGGSIQSVLSISQQGKLFTGSTDTRLYGFDTELLPIWDKSTGGIIKSAPALSFDGSTVYCVTSTANLIAFDVQSGNIKWGFATNGYVTNSPVVFLDSANTNIIYVGTSNGIFYAIRDKGTSGELFWQKQLSDTVFSTVAIYPDGSNTMLFLGSKGGYLYRMKWNGTNDDTWKVNLNSPVYSSPVIDLNGLIYIGTKSGLLSVYTKDFTSSSVPLTSFNFESGIIGTPAIGSNGNIYTGTEKGYLYSLDYSTSNLKMNWKANLYSSINSSALVTESGLIYIGTLKGDVFVLKEASLEKLSTSTTFTYAIWPTFKGNNLRSKVSSIIITDIKDNRGGELSKYQLLQNYPNPFNPTTRIKYNVGMNNHMPIQIKVYDILGKEVALLLNEHKDPGTYEIEFDAEKYNLSSGMYIYLIRAGEFYQVRKMILLK